MSPMPKLRPSAPRNHGRWRPAGVARLGVVLLVVAFVALTFNLILSSMGNSDSSTTTSTTASTTPIATTTTLPLNKIVPPGPKAS